MKMTVMLFLAGSLSVLSAAPIVELTPNEHSAACWDMRNIKDGKIPDGSGYGNEMFLGSKNNAPLPKSVQDGLAFDGQGGYAFVKAKDSLRIKGDFSIEIVFKFSASDSKATVVSLIGNKAASDKTSGFSLRYTTWQGKHLCFDYALNGKAETFKVRLPSALAPDVWYYASVVRKGDKLSCSLNGRLIGETTAAGAIDLYHRRPVTVGIYCAPWQRGKDGKLLLSPFRGVIRSIRISDTAGIPASAAVPSLQKRSETKASGKGLCGVLSWSRNAGKAKFVLDRLKKLGEQAELADENSDLSKYEVLFVPGAKEVPLNLRFRLPALLCAGHHVIFDGWPEITYDGARKAPEWGELLPGVTHCVKDTAWTYKRRGVQKQIVLKAGKHPVFNGMVLKTPGQVTGRTMNKCQWRLTSNHSTGMVEYHDCMDFTPVEICTKNGKTLGQQTAGVRHFCRFFPGATVLCADFQGKPGTSLLYGPHSGEYLSFLLDTVRSELPDQPTERYLRSLFALQKAVTEMKLDYVKAVYLSRDLAFHTENNRLLGKQGVEFSLKAFQTLEQKVIDLTSGFSKLRFNRMDFAVARKEKLVRECEKTVHALNQYIAAGEATLKKLLAENDGRRYTVPENGIVDIKLSYADYTPLSWGGAPGFVEYENGRRIAELGIDGSCGPNYAARGTFRPVTDKVLEQDRHTQKVFAKYAEETGLRKFTAHELPTHMTPLSLLEKYDDTPYIPDMKRGTLRRAKNARENHSARLSGAGIISSAAHSPEFEAILEFMAKRSADQKGVHTRSITLEGMQMGGYSEYGFSRYRDFLKGRYASIAKLNLTWGTKYRSFDEIRPPAKFPVTQSEYANNYEWIEFRSKELLRFYRHVSEVYRKFDGRHPLTGCINQASPLDAIEFYELNRYFDFAGSHNTPTSSAWYQIGLSRKGQRADNNEPKWISFSAPWNKSNAENEVQLCQRYKMIYAAAQGMTQFAPFEWLHGQQRFGEKTGYLYFAGAEFKGFADWKKKWQKVTGATAPKDHAETGIYWSFVTKSQTRGGVVDAERSKSLFRQYFAVLDNWNALLDDFQLPYEMVTRGKVKANEISHLKTLIVPQASFLEPEVMEKFLAFAENGGELILEGQVGHFDQYKREDDRIFETLGVVQLPEKAGKLSDGTPVQALTDAEEISPAFLSFEMIEPGKASVLKRYPGSSPAAVALPYGKGRVVCTGFSLAGTTPRRLAREFLKNCLARRPAVSSAAGIRIFPWKSRNGFLYVFVLNYSGEWRTVSVKTRGMIAEAYDAESGVPLNRKSDTVMVPLFPAGARILALRIQNGEK